ncbi:hypothetical protein AKJ16_DCAP11584, partial [Drosera capensis]
MQDPENEIPHRQDLRANAGVGDSNLMTIEYLRARLHSERSVSKAARERADELAKRVEELEEQLEIVTLQRKRAEKAALDVLAVLENHGVSDISEVVYSGSEEEGSLSGSNMGKNKSGKEGEREGKGEEESCGEPKLKGDDKEELSGSENDSTPSTGRSLSWRSPKELQRSTEKKYLDSSLRRRTHFALKNSSPRQLSLGKSCRQIQRREIKSVVEESRYESLTIGKKDNNADSPPSYPADSEELKGHFGNWNQKISSDGQVSGTEHEFDREMERALERQAQLIGRYEAEEKAQREWEENYRESNDSPLDSCERQSDVTEERDEIRAAFSSQSAPIMTSINPDQKTEGAAGRFSKEPSFIHFNSFKLTPHVVSESSISVKPDEVPASRTPAPDFAFPVVNNTQMHLDLSENNTLHLRAEPSFGSHPSHALHGQHSSSSLVSASRIPDVVGLPENGLESYAIVPHEGPQRLERVLDNLHYAKMLLMKEYSSLSLIEDGPRGGIPVEPPPSVRRDLEILRMPVSAAALSRVPTDFEREPSTQARLSVPDYHFLEARVLGGDPYLSRSMTARTSASERFHQNAAAAREHRIPARDPWQDFHHPDIVRAPYPSYQDMVSSVPRDGTVSSQFSYRAARMTPRDVLLFQGDHLGRDIFKSKLNNSKDKYSESSN